MPTADGKPIFEDLVALLQSKPSPFALAGHIDLITGGLVDLANRVKNLEHASLVNAESAKRANDTSDKQATQIAGLEHDRDDLKPRVAKVEEAPAADTKRLNALETRVRAVEGAVGSTGFATAKAEPAAPFKGPEATAPIATAAPAAPLFGAAKPA